MHRLKMLILAAFVATNVSLSARANDDQLTGNWGGLRDTLNSQGVTLTLPYTFESVSNVRGGIRTGTIGEGLFQPQLDLDLSKALGWQGSRIRVTGAITHGGAPTPTLVGNLLSPSNIEAYRIARIYELWFEQNTPSNVLSFRGGLMTADAEFLTTDTGTTFLNNSIGWLAWLGANLPAGGPAYPIPAPGARLRYKSDLLSIQAAVFSGDPSGRDGTNYSTLPLPRGTVFSFSGGVFSMLEATFLRANPALPASYKIGIWHHSSGKFGDQRFDQDGRSLADPMPSGDPRLHRGNWGLYGVVDQVLYRPDANSEQGLSAFLRVGVSPNDRNPVNLYADGGLAYTGLFSGRPQDKVGIAAGYARYSDQIRALDLDTRVANPVHPIRSYEAMLEGTYKAQLTPAWTLQPDLQYIFRPNGGVVNNDARLRKNATVFILRSAVNF